MIVQHVPVMVKEVIESLRVQSDGVYVDATLGLGGHASTILNRTDFKGRVIGIDRDKESLAVAENNLCKYKDQCIFVHEDFRNIDVVLKEMKVAQVDGVVLDLGISSFQLDNPQRGFSLRNEGPLDMRMNQGKDVSAFDLINSLSEKEISTLLKEYGQERCHQRIARNIVKQRSYKPLETTQELTELVIKSMPHMKRSRERIHPATRTFQAFRIAVNKELEAIEIVLDKCVQIMKVGGRIIVISFHSLEDKIVKNRFRHYAKSKDLNIVFKKPLRPSEEEVQENPRARSARLRVAERIKG